MPVAKNSMYLLFIILYAKCFSILILNINRNIIILNCDSNQSIKLLLVAWLNKDKTI